MIKKASILFCLLFVACVLYLVIPLPPSANTVSENEFPPEPRTTFVPDRINREKCKDETFYIKKSQIGYADSEIVNERCASLQAALADASQDGNLEEIRRLFQNGASAQSYAFPKNGGGDATAPVICAVRGGHTQAVKLLLDNGADVNTVYSCCMSSRSLLMMAVAGNDAATTKLLLTRGADVSYKDPYGDEEVIDVFYEADRVHNPVILGMLGNVVCERSFDARITCRLRKVSHLFQ